MNITFLHEAFTRFEDLSLAVTVEHLETPGGDRDQDDTGVLVPADTASGCEGDAGNNMVSTAPLALHLDALVLGVKSPYCAARRKGDRGRWRRRKGGPDQ